MAFLCRSFAVTVHVIRVFLRENWLQEPNLKLVEDDLGHRTVLETARVIIISSKLCQSRVYKAKLTNLYASMIDRE